MVDKTAIRYTYDRVITGEIKNGYSSLFRVSSDAGTERKTPENEKIALEIIRYAIEYYLQWSPEYAEQHLTQDIVDLMKLGPAFERIIWPEEMWDGGDPAFVVAKLYSDEVEYDYEQRICYVYDTYIKNRSSGYPKDFFKGAYGMYRAIISLRYVLAKYVLFTDPVSAYQFFYSGNITRWLEKMGLVNACTENFEFPIDYLNSAMNIELRNGCKQLYELMKTKLINKKKIKRG